jgi:L-amino acid N-acyltransferase YncA
MTHLPDLVSGPLVRAATAADAEAIARIYNHFIAHTTVTFEEDPVTADEMARRIADVQAASLPWLVAEQDAAVAGYAYATPWRVRRAYRFSAETTVYLAPHRSRQGLGTQLYRVLLEALRKHGIHAVLGGIALPNDASIALHERLGFRKVAHFEQTGFKFNQWIDVGYWERIL